MGGYGSGNGIRSRYGLVEDCEVATVRQALRHPATTLNNGSGDASLAVIRWTGDLFRDVLAMMASDSPKQTVWLTSTPGTFGGLRWWLMCSCGTRCYKLYRKPYAPAFTCRSCARVTYRSQRIDTADRWFQRARKLRKRATVDGSSSGRRRKWLRRPTYARLMIEANDYDGAAIGFRLARCSLFKHVLAT